MKVRTFFNNKWMSNIYRSFCFRVNSLNEEIKFKIIDEELRSTFFKNFRVQEIFYKEDEDYSMVLPIN